MLPTFAASLSLRAEVRVNQPQSARHAPISSTEFMKSQPHSAVMPPRH